MKKPLLLFVLLIPLGLFCQKITILPATVKAIKAASQNNNFTLVYFWASWCHPCITGLPELVNVMNEHKDMQVILLCDPFSKNSIIDKVIANSSFTDTTVYKLDKTVYNHGTNKNIKMFNREICPTCVKEAGTDLMLSRVYLLNNKGETVYFNTLVDFLSESKTILDKFSGN